MPISLQIICHSHEDEKLLGIMKKLEQKIKFDILPPKYIKEHISKKVILENLPVGKTPYDIEEPKADQE